MHKKEKHQENQKLFQNSNRERYIQELGTYVYVKSVEDSLSVLSLGRLCDELGNSYSWQPRENPKQNETEEYHHMLHSSPSQSKKLFHHWIQFDLARENLVPENGVEGTMFRLLERFGERMMDDDARPVRKKKTLAEKKKQGETLLRKHHLLRL